MASSPFLGEIRLVPYNFAPKGWAFCDGQILAISQNTALFSLLGTTYGGNGQTNFALPDLRGRHATESGQGPGLSNIVLGEQGGTETVTLLQTNMPAHTHLVNANNTGQQTTDRPSGAFLGKGGVYASTMNSTMNPQTIGIAGGSQPFSNRPPFLGLHYIIALVGIFPSRN
jgi:microcystin-dependent protein